MRGTEIKTGCVRLSAMHTLSLGNLDTPLQILIRYPCICGPHCTGVCNQAPAE